MANISVLNQAERQVGVERAVEHSDDSALSSEIIGKHEEADKRLKIAQEIEKETQEQNGNIDFDPSIFDERISELEEQRDNTADDREGRKIRSKINKDIKITKEVRGEVRLIGFDEVKQNYQERKEQLENTHPFLKDPNEVQRIKDQTFSDIDPTGTVEHHAYAENTLETIKRQKIFENLEKLRQEQYELVDQGRHDEAKEIFNSTYRDTVTEAYRLVGREHNKALEKKEEIDKKHEEMLRRLADGRTETKEDAEERERLQIESKALDNIIKKFSEEVVQNELAKKYSLWTHVGRNMESGGNNSENTTEGNNTTETEQTDNPFQRKNLKFTTKLIIGATAGVATASATILGGAALAGVGASSVLIIPGVIGAGLVFGKLRKGDIPFYNYFRERKTQALKDKINGLSDSDPRKAQYETELKQRLETSQKIKEITRIAGLGGSGGFVMGALSSVSIVYGVAAAGGVAAPEGYRWTKDKYEKTFSPQYLNLNTELGIDNNDLTDINFVQNGNLAVNERSGGELGKLHGQFHTEVMRRVQKENLNKQAYLNALKEIQQEHTQTGQVDLTEKINSVVQASTNTTST